MGIFSRFIPRRFIVPERLQTFLSVRYCLGGSDSEFNPDLAAFFPHPCMDYYATHYIVFGQLYRRVRLLTLVTVTKHSVYHLMFSAHGLWG